MVVSSFTEALKHLENTVQVNEKVPFLVFLLFYITMQENSEWTEVLLDGNLRSLVWRSKS